MSRIEVDPVEYIERVLASSAPAISFDDLGGVVEMEMCPCPGCAFGDPNCPCAGCAADREMDGSA
jgi:hypothetical protein